MCDGHYVTHNFKLCFHLVKGNFILFSMIDFYWLNFLVNLPPNFGWFIVIFFCSPLGITLSWDFWGEIFYNWPIKAYQTKFSIIFGIYCIA